MVSHTLNLNIYNVVLLLVDKLDECHVIHLDADAYVINIFYAMFGLSLIIGISFLPILVKNLRGPRRVYMVAQQICILFYLTYLFLTRTLFSENHLVSTLLDPTLTDQGYFLAETSTEPRVSKNSYDKIQVLRVTFEFFRDCFLLCVLLSFYDAYP